MSKKTKAAREAKLEKQIREFGGKRMFICPQCDKPRMPRPHSHILDPTMGQYKTYSGETVLLYNDICDFCLQANKIKYFEPPKSDIHKVLKAIKDGAREDVSLEDLL